MPKQTAIITGASKGIGRAIALRLSTHYDIVAIARNATELEALSEQIAATGGRCTTLSLDITDGSAVAEQLEAIDASVLINNAGIGIMKPFIELTRDEWRRTVDLNLNALFDVTRAVLPPMIERKSGHILFIGSIAGRSAFVGGTAYIATKAAVQGFTESLMLELREYGIKVSVVNPGGVATEFGGSSDKAGQQWKLAAEDVADAVASVIATPPNVLVHRVEVRTLTVPKRK